MEYQSRTVKWYWVILFLLFCTFSVYTLFTGNPYLYSHVELRSALDAGDESRRIPVPTPPKNRQGEPSAITFFPRYNVENTAVDPIPTARSKNHVVHSNHTVNLEGAENDNVQVAQDDSGFYVAAESGWVWALGLEGQIRWRYRFLQVDEKQGLMRPLLDGQSIYMVSYMGEIVCLNKSTGALRWSLSLGEPVVSKPFLFDKALVVPTKGQTGVDLQMVHRLFGELDPKPPRFDFKADFEVSQIPSLKLAIISYANKVSAVSTETWQVAWTQTLTDPIFGPTVTVENQIYLSTLGAKVVRLDASRKGKIDWETDLPKPPVSAPTHLPIVLRLVVEDSGGALNAIEEKSGKILWRTVTENRTGLHDPWAARLKGAHIEEFKMDWLHKGWTIWSACSDRRICVLTPNKGQVVERFVLPNIPLNLPLALEHRWVFFTRGAKAGHYTLTHIVEDGESRRLKALAESAKSH